MSSRNEGLALTEGLHLELEMVSLGLFGGGVVGVGCYVFGMMYVCSCFWVWRGMVLDSSVYYLSALV